MTDEAVDIKKLVDSYVWQVNDVEKELIQLASKASELTDAVEADKEQRETTAASLDALRRRQAAREAELDELRYAFGDAQLDNDVNEEQRIRRRKQEVDEELSEIQETIRSSVIPSNDYGKQAATLQVQKDSLEARLPKQFYNTSANLHPMLEAVSEVLRDDAERLRKRWSSIKVPQVFSKQTIERARAGRNPAHGLNSGYLERAESKRREKLARYENVAGNTDAMHAAMTRTYREPEPSVKATTDADGRLSGEAIRAALAAKQSA